ncbi:MAG TPA: hypothetical protein VM406_04905 [Noviherbaspirillum sp.]|nr:hypothetical protein [Noviherbaspirillum sp.]
MRYTVLLLSLALAACATTGPQERGIAIETATGGQPLAGTQCTVSTAAGSWEVVTPAVIDVGAPSGDLRVVCNRPGFRTSETIHRAYLPAGPGPTVGVGIGGGSRHTGASIGMSVPFGVGGQASYPRHIRVDMNPL